MGRNRGLFRLFWFFFLKSIISLGERYTHWMFQGFRWNISHREYYRLICFKFSISKRPPKEIDLVGCISFNDSTKLNRYSFIFFFWRIVWVLGIYSFSFISAGAFIVWFIQENSILLFDSANYVRLPSLEYFVYYNTLCNFFNIYFIFNGMSQQCILSCFYP